MSIPPTQPSPLAPGYMLDRYELLFPIADGGMASVWIARQTGKHGFQKLVAIKTILQKYAADPTFQQMFLDEVRIASRIEHIHVTQILDVGDQHGVTYLVMEHVDGDALSKVHREAKQKGKLIPPGILLRIMADACGGLHVAHELMGADGKLLGVVHRDVSPQNILVSTKGVAKVIDFGIAKARDRVAGDTTAGQLKGKVRYMAPEQALGQEVDRRADIWAIGASLYHLLSGKAPFEGENDMQTLYLLASGQPFAPIPDLHPAIAAVVNRSLSYEPDGRFPTAAAMQQALEEAMRQAEMVTTTSGVATYLADEMGARAEKRKEAISLGLKAAEAREKYNDLMRSNHERSQPSKSGAGSGSGSGAGTTVAFGRGERSSDESLTPGKASAVSGVDIVVDTKSAGGQTLGSGVTASEKQKSRKLAFVLVALALGGVAAAGVMRANRNRAAAASAVVTPAPTGAEALKPPPLAPPELTTRTTAAEPPVSSSLSEVPSANASSASAHGRPARLPVRGGAPHGPVKPPAVASAPAAPTAETPAPSSTVAPRTNFGF